MRAYRGHDQALNELEEAPRRRSLRSLGSEREPATLSYGGGALSPTSRQHAYKSAVLALGLPSYPPQPTSGCSSRSHHRHPSPVGAAAAFRRSF